jgi:hypothetical protein
MSPIGLIIGPAKGALEGLPRKRAMRRASDEDQGEDAAGKRKARKKKFAEPA